jgi:fatty acid desaturase
MIALLLLVPLAFGLSAAVRFSLLKSDVIRSFGRPQVWWRRLFIAIAIGYVLMGGLAALLWNVEGGHPPPVIIPMIGAMLWTCIAALGVAIVGGMAVADELTRQRYGPRP